MNADEALRFVSAPDLGGAVLFSGTVRSPNEGEVIDHLEYEVWEEQVERELRAIARAVLERHDAARIYVAHRVGRVEVGEPSVLVAVGAAHRDAAFTAARDAIDTLKTDASIWKKEVTATTQRWVGLPDRTEATA